MQRGLAWVLCLAVALPVIGCTCQGGREGGPDAAASGSAPPIASAPAIPTEIPPLPPVRPLSCPQGMMPVKSAFCVDRWEASLVDKVTGMPLSPYYPPERRFAIKLAETWEAERATVGDEAARATPIPDLPAWQRDHEPEPMAVSRPGVTPNGYLSGTMAARACKNAGKRLCRPDEWRTACGGDKGQRFPYGNDYKQGACNIFRSVHPAKALHDNASIGHLDPRLNLVKDERGEPLLRKTGATAACKSEWEGDAAWDMNGNLDEWVEDENGRFLGGFFSRSKKDGCESTVTAHGPTYLDYSTGTRCCWSPDPPADPPPKTD